MFTGLIQDVGVVERVLPGATTDVWVRTALGASDFALGESIAIDGAPPSAASGRARASTWSVRCGSKTDSVDTSSSVTWTGCAR